MRTMLKNESTEDIACIRAIPQLADCVGDQLLAQLSQAGSSS